MIYSRDVWGSRRKAKQIVSDDTHILHKNFNITLRETSEDLDVQIESI